MPIEISSYVHDDLHLLLLPFVSVFECICHHVSAGRNNLKTTIPMSTSGGNYRQSLTKALSYESPLDFASGGTFTQCPLVPGVAIDGYGVIGLPVHPHVINELIKVGSLSYGMYLLPLVRRSAD